VRLTLHTDYGLRTLVYLASSPGRVVSTTEIGRAYGISKNHLVRVAQSLRGGGFIELSPGRAGGLALARSAAAIRIGDVVRALEPELRLVECFDQQHNTCPIAPKCGLQGIIADSLEAFLRTLDRYTVADVVTRSGPTLASYFIPAGALVRERATKATPRLTAKKPAAKPATRKRASARAR
jgi:Rrf2 family transcriptional regulator, nitric oxide-sensitive transcriptional repressor